MESSVRNLYAEDFSQVGFVSERIWHEFCMQKNTRINEEYYEEYYEG